MKRILKIPKDQDLILETNRLILEPTQDFHANETIQLFQDPSLFKFIPRDPQKDLGHLIEVYSKRQLKISPNGDQLWLNWIGRDKKINKIIGEFQSTIYSDFHSDIAYMVDIPFQKMGFAYEAMEKIINFLKSDLQVKSIQAYIDTRNDPSINLIKKLGFKQIDLIQNADEFKGSYSNEYIFEL